MPLAGSTFGDKGNKIIKQLENNVAANMQGAAKKLIDLIRDSKPWLELAIDARDPINDFKSGGIDLQTFTVSAQKEGSETKVWTPRLHPDQTIRELMDILNRNVFEFCEFFMGFAMIPRLTKVAIQYNNLADTKAIRWKMVPIQLMRQYEKDGSCPRTWCTSRDVCFIGNCVSVPLRIAERVDCRSVSASLQVACSAAAGPLIALLEE